MTRVVLDTNVLLSAVIFGGKPEQIISLARAGRIELFTSPAILAELAGVLISKFQFSPEMAAEAVGEIGGVATLVRPRRKVNTIREDDADNRVLECALAAKTDYIVSGDRHLLGMRCYKGIAILTPTEFLGVFRR